MGTTNNLFAQNAAGAIEPSRGAGIAVTIPNALAIRGHFADMRASMAIDAHSKRTAGHDWFENRAGGMDNFNKLQEHVLNPNFAGDAQFPKEAVDKLRTTMGATNYNAAEVERQVRGIVTHASIPTTGTPGLDTKGLETLIEKGTVAPAAPAHTEPVARQPARTPSTPTR